MNRNEEVTCLKEMNLNFRHMSPDGVDLVNSRLDDPFSTGYQVRIQTLLGNETKQLIRLIAANHNLPLNEEPGKVVIYQPKAVVQATP